jgi:hypothetical protein
MPSPSQKRKKVPEEEEGGKSALSSPQVGWVLGVALLKVKLGAWSTIWFLVDVRVRARFKI